MPDIVLPADVTQRATGSHWSTRLQQVTGRIGLRGARGALVAFGDYNADNFVDLFLVEDVLEENNASASVRELQAWTWRGDAQTGHFALSKANKWKMPGLVGMIPGDFNGDGELDAIVMTEHGRCAEHGAVQMLLCNHTFACAADPTGTALDVPAAAQPLALDFDGDMQADLLAAYRPFDRSGASGDACSVPAGGMCTRNMSLCCDCALECSFGPVSAGGGVDWQSGGETGCQPGGRCPALLHNDDGLRCEETNILTLFDANAGYSGSVASDGDSTVQDTDRGTRLQKKGRYLQESHDARSTADEQPAEFGARGGVGEELPSPRVFPLHGLAGVSTSVFFDLFEDGIWDVLAQYPNGTLTAWRQPPGGLDNYFLKVVTADGACAPAPMDGKLVMSNLPKFGGAPPPPDRRANHGASDTDYADDVDETDESSDDHDDTVLLSSGAMVHGSDGGVGGGDVPPPEDEDADAPSVRAHDAPPPPPITPASPGTRCVDKRAGAQGYMAGVNQPGVSYQFLTTLPTRWELVDASEAWQWNRPKQQRAGTQLCQSGYSPLLTPYVLAGLGTTNDYVEELMVGLPSGQVRGFAQAIIPNSRLVVIPFPYNQTDQWELRLYLEPRQQLYVGLVLVCALVIVGAVILLLELRERMQDAREKRALAPALPL